MKYIVDDKKLDAATFIAFVNQVWQGSYDVEKRSVHWRKRSTSPLMIMRR